MNPSEQLAKSLLSESKAYGYTLTIWGGGAILMNQYGSPKILVIFCHVIEALIAFGVLATATFDGFFSDPNPNHDEKLILASMVHVVATFGNLLLGYGIWWCSIQDFRPFEDFSSSDSGGRSVITSCSSSNPDSPASLPRRSGTPKSGRNV